MKKINIFINALIWAVIAVQQIKAQENENTSLIDEVIVSASKIPLPDRMVGKNVLVLDKEDLLKRGFVSIQQALQTLPGIEINQSNGAEGSTLGLYVRGGRGHQTLILVDGMPVTDPSGVQMVYDLNQIAISQVEKIEVLQGASATLYGTGAVTAVINIVLKKAKNEGFHGEIGRTIMTDQSQNDDFGINKYQINVNVNQKFKRFDYILAVQQRETQGISSRTVYDNSPLERDRYDKNNLLLQLNWRPNDQLKLGVFSALDRQNFNFDNGFGATIQDLDRTENRSNTQQFRVGFNLEKKINEAALRAVFQYKKSNRDTYLYNSFSSGVDFYNYQSESLFGDLYYKKNWGTKITLVSGLDYQFHNMLEETPFGGIESNLAFFNTINPYTNAVFSFSDDFNLLAGARFNNHSEYGNEWTYYLNPSYSFGLNNNGYIKAFASYGTAYVVPSLYQLFSQYGNLDLTPEKSATTELGFDAQLLPGVFSFQTTAYLRKETDAIIFYNTPDWSEAYYINDLNESNEVKGITSSFNLNLNKFSIDGNYSFTEVVEERNDRIPRHKINSGVQYQFKAFNFGLRHQFVSSRSDAGQKLSPYQLFHLNGLWKMKERLSLNIGLKNLFNVSYREVLGYQTLGRNYNIGLQYQF